MHLHGMPQQVIAKDGWTLPEPALSRTPSSSLRANASTSSSTPPRPATWAFHCHILTHAEGPDGMFGMVTALVVEER